jgi:arylsulfatase
MFGRTDARPILFNPLGQSCGSLEWRLAADFAPLSLDARGPVGGMIGVNDAPRAAANLAGSQVSMEVVMRQVTGLACVFALGLSLVCPIFAFAQEASAPSGAPNATTSIPGDQIPPLPLPFGGVITDRGSESTPWWPPRVVPPKGAPNVLLILTDDQGYGVYSTFGGVIPAPALESVAAEGLRYTQFHSTALCSPTRAALLTGRNHHSVGFGIVSEGSTGYPGYNSMMPLDKATVAATLQQNGYATSWFGKNHNTPAFQLSEAGPFTQWPSGMGFD